MSCIAQTFTFTEQGNYPYPQLKINVNALRTMTQKCSPRPLQQQHKSEQLLPSYRICSQTAWANPAFVSAVMLSLKSGITHQFWAIVCHMWCRSDLALLSWVKLGVALEWVCMAAASLLWRQTGWPTLSEVFLLRYSAYHQQGTLWPVC